MASTNKTANLGLNQWVLSDPLLMEDMNADNQKIDAAVGSAVYVKLMDVTTAANAVQVDLDVSGIDFTKYAEVIVVVSAKFTPLNIATYLYAKVNNAGAFVRDVGETAAQTRAYVGYTYAGNNADFVSSMKLEFSGIPNAITQAYLAEIKTSGISFYGGYYVHDQHAIIGYIAANTRITTINFLTDKSGVSLTAGSKFEVYGVKK